MIGLHLGSAMIGSGIVPELVKNLHLWTDDLSVIHLNTDRSNIHLVVHHMQHPLNSYEDLGLIVKKNIEPGDTSEIPCILQFAW